MLCFAAIQNVDWNSHYHGIIVGFSLCTVVLLVLLILAVALVTTQRHLLATKCRWRRGRRRVDGGSDRSDQDQSVITDETCKRLLDPTAIAPASNAVTTACGGVEFYLKVVTPDSAADNLSPSSASSGDSEAKSERRQLGDGSTCYDRDLVCTTLKREILAATTGAAWNCGLCNCDRSSPSHAGTTALPPTKVDESSTSNHRCSWSSCCDRRFAGVVPTAIDRTIPRCRVAAPCIRSCFAGSGTGMASTSRTLAQRPRSWCSCMHVDNRLCNDCCPLAVAEPRSLPRCGDETGNDRRHVTTVDRRCRHKSTTASRNSLQTT